MIRVCFHIDNFEKTDNNLYTLVGILINNQVLNNQSVIIYDNDYGSLQEVFAKYTVRQVKSIDINSQLNETNSRLIYKFESVHQDEKSVLFSVTEAPLVIHNPKDLSDWNQYYNFRDFENKSPIQLEEQSKNAVTNKISQGLKSINSFGYIYDNKFIMILHGNNTPQSSEGVQHNDIFVNIVPSIVEDKINNMKKQLGLSDALSQQHTKKAKKTYKFKFTCNWMSSEQLYNNWKRMYSPGIVDLVHTTGDDYDFLVIVNRPSCNYKPENSIVYRMEPYIETNRYYNEWNLHDKSEFMYFLEHSNFRNNSEWWIANANTFNIPKNTDKNDRLSAVISSQYDMVGHKFRVDFIKYFQQNSKYEVDTYGYSNKHDFKNYKGSLPDRQKDEGLFPYKYTIAVENCDITNYFTEKLYDAIMSECLPFYWGCNNVEEFINPQAFIRLDKDDLQRSLQIIEEAISNDEWSKRVDIIREEKRKILDHFNVFTRTSSLIYMKRHMKFFLNSENEISFVENTKFNINEFDMSISDNMKTAEHMLRNYDDSVIKIWEYSTLLTHHNLWKQCASGNDDFCIVQGSPKNNFVDHMCTILSQSETEYDVISLHENPSNGYIISPKGARKLLNLVNTYGMFSSLDKLLNSKDLGIVNAQSFKQIVNLNKFHSNLSLHLFKQINGMLDNTQELFCDRVLNTDAQNVTVVLDF